MSICSTRFEFGASLKGSAHFLKIKLASRKLCSCLASISVIFLCSASLPGAGFAQNLIQNGGFEIGSGQVTYTGHQSGTISPAPHWIIQTNAVDNPPGGSTVTATIVSQPRTEGFQAISVRAAGAFDGIYERFSNVDTLVSSLSADLFVQTGQVNMILFSSDGLRILGVSTTARAGAWQTVSLTPPAGTLGGLLAFYDAYSSPVSFTVDNVRVIGAAQSSVPEPSTWIAAVGGFFFIGFALRRRQSAFVLSDII